MAAEPFRDFFRRSTGRLPHPFQERFATAGALPSLLHAPTGSGKTQAILTAWLYRRFHAGSALRATTPLRLVYALPMRVLVEQAWEVTNEVLERAGLGPDDVGRYLVMGGHADADWARLPERPAILIGTIDMLLSRALNRGYGAGRARWPIDFGLLNADCLWVLDEMQLMDVAATTAAQLDGLRQKLGTWRACHSLWMSATIDAPALKTVDHPEPGLVFTIGGEDVAGELGKRIDARKTLEKRDGDGADVLIAEHIPGSVSLAVHNTVRSALDTYRRLRRRAPTAGADLLLLHSRFRPPDRERMVQRLHSSVPPGGRVICATQVVEAGVDLSARLLVTEVAPWASVVQRLGRCNRFGELEEGLVRWVDVRRPEPYRAEDVDEAREILRRREGTNMSAWELMRVPGPNRPPEAAHVLRRRDLLDLFDTAPDLSGADIDVSRFIRDVDEVDCLACWREVGDSGPAEDAPEPAADELCPVPIAELRAFLRVRRSGWTWDSVVGEWRQVRSSDLRPGMVVVLAAASGGYTAETGWDPSSRDPVPPVEGAADPLDANQADPLTHVGAWVDLATHTQDVVTHCDTIRGAALGDGKLPEVAAALAAAAHAHDWGKALARFQEALLATADETEREGRRNTLWAKSAHWIKSKERNPRHELASALALLASNWLGRRPPEPWADLVLFLVAAHHGKARVTIRPWPQDLPGEEILGVRQGEELPAINLHGLALPPTTLRLDALRMGETSDGSSWATRMLTLRDHSQLGPFRMAHLEALLRTADWRASEEEAAGG